MLALWIKWMSAVLQLSACWERGSLEPLLSGTVTRSGGLTAWPWRWPRLHPPCIRARKVKGLHINNNLKAVTNTTTIPLCFIRSSFSLFWSWLRVDILIPEIWGDVSSLISCAALTPLPLFCCRWHHQRAGEALPDWEQPQRSEAEGLSQRALLRWVGACCPHMFADSAEEKKSKHERSLPPVFPSKTRNPFQVL